MAGLTGSVATMSAGRRFRLALCLLWCIAGISVAEPPRVYDIDLPAESLPDALNGLSEQTGVPVVFPYDLVKDRIANSVAGRHTLQEAVNALLKDTGLSGGLSDKGVLTVSQARSAVQRGETIVTHDENQQNTSKKKTPSRTAFAAFFASVAAAFSASAEEAADANGDQINMQTVLVTAQKREERQQDVPIAMTVVNPQTLAETGQNHLADYFASVPGLNLSAASGVGGAGTQYLTIRGLSAGINQNPTVATVIDDIPVASSVFRNDGAFTQPDLDPSDLARIEVLKGPQGTLYGADSLGGLVKFVTAEPSTKAFSARAEVVGVDIPQGGQGYAVRGAANIPVSDTFAVRASAFNRKDPGYIDNLTTAQKDFNASDTYGARLGALWRPVEELSLKLSAMLQDSRGDTSQVNSNNLLQFPQGDLKFTALPGTTRYETQMQLYTAIVNAKVAGMELTSLTGYAINRLRNWSDVTTEFGGLSLYYVPGFPNGSGAAEQSHWQTDKISQEIRLAASLGNWLEWRLGGFYTHEITPDSFQNFWAADITTGSLVGSWYDNHDTIVTFSERAVFGDLTFKFTDQFDVELGGRQEWNRFEQVLTDTGPSVMDFDGHPAPFVYPTQRANGQAFTYQVTPRFKLSSDLMVYARVASGYRIGGSNATNALEVAGGIPATYAPDKTTNYEIGIKGGLLDNRLRFDAAAYYIAWKDFQLNLTKQVPVAGQEVTYGYTGNAGNAKSEGLELSVEMHPTEGFTMAVQGSYDNAVLTQDLPAASTAYGQKGDKLPYSMRFSGGVTANQVVRLSDSWTGTLGGAFNYVGSRPYEFTGSAKGQRIEFPSYSRLDFHAGARYQLWLVNLYVNNVTDRRGVVGFVNAPAVGVTGGYYASVIQPRTIGLSIARTF